MFWASVRGGRAGMSGLKKWNRLLVFKVLHSVWLRTSHVRPLEPVQELLTTVEQPGGRPPLPVSVALALASRLMTLFR